MRGIRNKIFPRFLLLFGCIVFIFSGCVSVGSINDSNAIKAELDSKMTSLIDTTLFKSRKIVVLETVNQSLINSVTRILTYKDTLFIFDKRNQKVFVFKDNGKFISTIERKGQGPTEYSQLLDVCFDESTKQLIFLSSIPRKLLYFNLQGKFIKEQPLDLLFTELKADKEFIYLLRSSSSNNVQNEYSLYVMNKKTGVITEKFSAVWEINSINSGGKAMVAGKDILFSRRFDNMIYRLKNGDVEPFYSLDFGKSNLPEDIKDKQYSPIDFAKECSNRNVIYSITNPFNTDKYLFFTTNIPSIYSLKAHTKVIKQYHDLFDSEIRIGKSNYIPVEGKTSRIAVEYNVGNLKRGLDVISSVSKNMDSYKKKVDLTNGLSADSNPVLFIYELK